MGMMTTWGMCLYSWCCGKVDLGGGDWVSTNLSSQDEDDQDTPDRQPLVCWIVTLFASWCLSTHESRKERVADKSRFQLKLHSHSQPVPCFQPNSSLPKA